MNKCKCNLEYKIQIIHKVVKNASEGSVCSAVEYSVPYSMCAWSALSLSGPSCLQIEWDKVSDYRHIKITQERLNECVHKM
jgi:hypothetical protein